MAIFDGIHKAIEYLFDDIASLPNVRLRAFPLRYSRISSAR
jgi:hypothetical protein